MGGNFLGEDHMETHLSTLNFGKWMAFLMKTVKLMASSSGGSLWVKKEARTYSFVSLFVFNNRRLHLLIM